MPAKKSTTSSDGETPLGLTDGELRFIKAVFDNMTQKPDADWEGVAGALGLKDAKCAKERFRQMSVRHGWRDGNGNTSSPRKSKAASATIGDTKITKKPRTPRKKAAAKQSSDSDSEVKAETKAEPKNESDTEVKEEAGSV